MFHTKVTIPIWLLLLILVVGTINWLQLYVF
jgi:hypothetical protein